VSDKLPHLALLGTDVPVLENLLKKEERALMAVTWSQAHKLKQSQFEQSRDEESEVLGEAIAKLVNIESRAEVKVEG